MGIGGISFGINAGFVQLSEDLLSLGIDNDKHFASNINETIPTFSTGVLFNDTYFFVGLSAINLIKAKNISETAFNLENSLYLHMGYRFFASKYRNDFLITPSFLLKKVKGVAIQLDTNVLVNYKNKVEIGVGYRTESAFNIMMGCFISSNLQLLYNYSYGVNKRSPVQKSQGLVIRYRFGNGFSS